MCRNRTDSKQFCGGFSVMSGAVAMITNCTITGNKADKSANSDGEVKPLNIYSDIDILYGVLRG